MTHRARFAIPDDLDVVAMVSATANGRGDPSVLRSRDRVMRALHTDAGPATVELQRVGTDAVVVAWGEGAERAVRDAPALIGLQDNLDDFDPTGHPVVARLARRARSLRFGRSNDLWGALFATILGQRVIATEAHRSFRRLVHRLGEPAPGPADVRLLPHPGVIGATGSWEFHRAGVERARSDIIVRVAREMPRLANLVEQPPAKARPRLEAIRGIGPWTSAGVASKAFGDPDAISIGDYNLPHTVAWNLAGEDRADDARMLELLEPFAGHRARVAVLLKTAGSNPPAYGPKLGFRNVERH